MKNGFHVFSRKSTQSNILHWLGLFLCMLLFAASSAWAKYGALPGSGTESDPGIIEDDMDWETFARAVNNAHSFEGKFFKLGADITVSEMVGDYTGGKPFSGTFDGDGHTITANIEPAEFTFLGQSKKGLALFGYIKGATIKNLTVAGSINGFPIGFTSGMIHTAGLVGYADGGEVVDYVEGKGIVVSGKGNTIENCVVSATVTGGTHIGGILGHGLSSDIIIRNCVFKGKLVGGSTAKGVFFGWGDKGGAKKVWSNLYIMQEGQDTQNLDLVKMNDGSVNVLDCYKTADVGDYGSLAYLTPPVSDWLFAFVKRTAVDGTEYYYAKSSSNNPIVIGGEDDWNKLVASVNGGYTYEGVLFKLGADITVSQKVGDIAQGKYFSGTFDGDGHTITAAINESGTAVALFGNIKGATIKNLTLTGSVTGGIHTAGLVGASNGSGNRIENTVVAATITGGSHIGGILGHGRNSDITIDNCVFKGKLVGGTTAKGVLFGWGDNGGTKSVKNCLYIQQNGQNTTGLDLARMSDGSVSVTDSYKTANVGSYGKRAYLTAPADALTFKKTAVDGTEFYIVVNSSGENPLVLIENEDDWIAFATAVNAGNTYDGEFVKLGADITVSQKVGDFTQGKYFSGMFDGDGHTITAAIKETGVYGVALFGYIKGATIKNLTVVGSVSGIEHSAGLVGYAGGSGNRIENIVVAATIALTGYRNSPCIGGILGHVLSSDITIDNCVFKGKLGDKTYTKGVFFGGGDNGGTKKVTNCLYIMQEGQETWNLDLVKMDDGSVTMTDCYKTTDVGAYGAQVSLTAPAYGLVITKTVLGTTIYGVARISGVEPLYPYTGNDIDIAYNVVGLDGKAMVEGTDYTKVITPLPVKEKGSYTVTFTAKEGSGYVGSKTFGLLVGGGAYSKMTDISTLAGNYVAQDGELLVGKLVGNYKVSVADGATVTLGGVNINGDGNLSGSFAGLTCEGDCNVVLAEGSENIVKGPSNYYSGIYVPEGKTLTIDGKGSLDVTGGVYAAGIGGGYWSSNSSCGNITITDNVTKVVAKGGSKAPYSVGRGAGNSSVGTITIGGEVSGDIAGLFTYPRVPFTVVFNKNDGSGTEEHQTLYIGNEEPALRRNTFTRDGFFFVNWNTKADGSGSSYRDGDAAPFLADKEGVTVTLYAQWNSGVGVELSTLTGDYVVQDGELLMGKLVGNYKVSIADGATVTLGGVNINGDGNLSGNFAGLTCEGDCKIELADGSENIVKGLSANSIYVPPGIYVPESKTLTIDGKGSLDVGGSSGAAGIGSGSYGSCGNIVINGGTITATGRVGIGSGTSGSCGNITINGGSIYATGAYNGAGIGVGARSFCGDITIGSDAKVTAIKAEKANHSIGTGLANSSVGTITIGGVVTESVTQSPFIYPGTVYTISFDANGGSGTMPNLKITHGLSAWLPANRFTRNGYSLVGWNTAKDGSGTFYPEGGVVLDLTPVAGATVTLYAQWQQGDSPRVDISKLVSNYVVPDGVVLTGTLEGSLQPYSISIADGATVTFDGVTVNGVYSEDYQWAGITCEGDCKIVLAGGSTNTVKAFYRFYPGIFVPKGKTLTIDGTGSLDVTGVVGAAGIGGGSNDGGYYSSCGNIVINGGTITATGNSEGAVIGAESSCGKIEINGGTVNATNIRVGNGGPAIGYSEKIVINGGTVNATSNNRTIDGRFHSIYNIAEETTIEFFGTIEINGGTVNATGVGGGIGNFENVVINGGSVTATATLSEDFEFGDSNFGGFYNKNIEINDGTVVARGGYGSGIGCYDNGNITIKGGDIFAKGGDGSYSYKGGAGIGASEKSCGDITITGGKIRAIGGNNSAAIGGGRSDKGSVGNILITGGEIVATGSGDGAAIGAGAYGPVGKITITGGDITADSKYSRYYGVGIGAGKNASCGDIEISGGTVSASAGNFYAAGIGGGYNGGCNNILISGGIVTATGALYGAGIGGGYNGGCNNILISGGIVTATGDLYGAGIGGGPSGGCNNILISGGTVTATGGEYSAGIGGGNNSSCGDITITDNVTRVSAVKGGSAPYSIGKGYRDNSSVGTITIGGEVTEGISISPYSYPRLEYTVVFDGNGGVGAMESQTLAIGNGETLNRNSFTRDGFVFAGWNTAKDGSGNAYIDTSVVVDLTDKAGKTVTLYAQWWDGDLSMLKADGGNHVALDGFVLRGSLASASKVSIADKASVTLDGVNINESVVYNEQSKDWAGINCEGDCKIVLAEGSSNIVNGYYYGSGIYVPEGKTLTIEGNGSLDATGGDYSAGIGGGYYSYNSSCGNITITDNVAKVTAVKGIRAPYSIGKGYGDNSSVGTISIGGVVTESIEESPYTYPKLEYTEYSVAFDGNGGSGTMDNQTLYLDVVGQTLPPNSYTREGYSFVGWNTEKNGGGVSYPDGGVVPLFWASEAGKTVTLYAQWWNGDLSKLVIDGSYVAQDGYVLTGTLASNSKISIADNATVTLGGVNINGDGNLSGEFAGITCEGDCKIVLAEGSTNTVKGFYCRYPGIFVPQGKTLTIDGNGSLEALGGEDGGAGIGGSDFDHCGNIVINGGIITATGGNGAAGIGSGDYEHSCGDITITDNVTKVTAVKGGSALYSVGKGSYVLASVGTITIGGEVTNSVFESPYVYMPPLIKITDKADGKHAVINGRYDGTDALAIAADVSVDDVVLNRSFSTAGFSTITMPFGIKSGKVSGAKQFLRFIGVYPNEQGVREVHMKRAWCDYDVVSKDIDAMNISNEDKEKAKTSCREVSGADVAISAYTPYVVQMKDNSLTFDVSAAEPVTLKKTPAAADTVVGNWVFRGTLAPKTWEPGDPEIGNAYGYMAGTGDFRKVGDYSSIGALRSYLVYEKKTETQTSANVPGLSNIRANFSTGTLPTNMDVVIVDDDANGKEHRTVIGRFNTRTGEFTPVLPENRTFDVKGRRVNETRSVGKGRKAKGVYYGRKK